MYSILSGYVMRKLRIWTIRGFCCANLWSELLHNNPRIVHANLGSEDVLCKHRIHGFAVQTSDPHAIFWYRATKPRASAATNSRSIVHTKQLGHPRQRSHGRSRKQSSSAIHVTDCTLRITDIMCTCGLEISKAGLGNKPVYVVIQYCLTFWTHGADTNFN